VIVSVGKSFFFAKNFPRLPVRKIRKNCTTAYVFGLFWSWL